ncbi:branched-chain amino acid ABC transporter permease [Caballeronia sp. SEWSISQ10-4 2]|uniref:branched-chain amino acid ABC transporter permease n=1 Tax=Caballeronia sp. SEWSISQ10-4 2 TaxID=2937438 RepID=UPI0026520CF8|nr:branched-chain amino acid ABC transporter permease [Caballeronia sp. SEWSISQ10-4 2]MDN7182254.1 branched-chain amino acid ABC transporter permease [Caballeronia sp. SEWSISQ10-4 2]
MKRSVFPSLMVVLLLLVPFMVSSPFYLDLLVQIMVASLIASSLNLLLGIGGLFSFAQTALAGSVSYAVALGCITYGVSPWLAAMGAIGIGLVISLAIGALALRTTGLNIGMITLALAQVLWGLALHWGSVTGGENGISGIPRPSLPLWSTADPVIWYEYVTVIFILIVVALRRFIASPLGVCLGAVRSQPKRMSALGYNIWLIRMSAFAIAGLVASLAGVLFVFHQQFISPHALALGETAETLLMVIVGGPATLLGPIVGAVIVVVFRVIVSSYFDYWPMLLGALFVAVVVFLPEGVVPGVSRVLRRPR